MKKLERYLQYTLAGIMILLLSLNLTPALQAYQISRSIHSEIPGGSSLAERYLILGDWPSSVQFPNTIAEHKRYEIIQQSSD